MTAIPKSASREKSVFSVSKVLVIGFVACAWGWQSLAMSSRVYFLLSYNVITSVTPELEPFAASTSGSLTLLAILSAWLVGYWFCHRHVAVVHNRALLFLAVGCLPFVACGLRIMRIPIFSPGILEVLWTGAWTGLSFGELAKAFEHEAKGSRFVALKECRKLFRYGWLLVAGLSFGCMSWWFAQSQSYYQNFMLGYNDFGHFLQRVANTAAGRGFLLESPILPTFWDHFNPGLLAIVPLWILWPHPSLVFLLQAVALAGSALLIFFISRSLEQTNESAVAFALAWLVQPSLGQMNLAYTYGWHPITLAIPLLLIALLALISKRFVVAVLATIAALTLEEGVFVIVGLSAATCFYFSISSRRNVSWLGRTRISSVESLVLANIHPAVWAAWAFFSLLGFWLVFQFSGLAEFQTGRFVALGDSPLEILLSPLLRPTNFWGQVLRVENLILVAALWLPCGIVGLCRGWRWLLPTLLPLGVLIVWDHRPAHSFAFQYASILLPLFWLSSMIGSQRSNSSGDDSTVSTALPQAVTALTTGLFLSVLLGQFPFSSSTLLDVAATTYDRESPLNRDSNFADGRWLQKQVQAIRASGAECLATGRIAAHLVGNRDLETVGQYFERRDRLAELPDRRGDPIKHYQWIVLDRLEQFQQQPSQTAEVEREAREAGFEIFAAEFDILILHQRPK